MLVSRLHRSDPVRSDAGYTLIEMLVVVTIVAVLAAVAIVAYKKYIQQANMSEIPQMFGEFATKEEQYHTENNEYVSTATNEDDLYPLPLRGKDNPTDITNYATDEPEWKTLRINPGKTALYCAYGVIAGDAGDAGDMGVAGEDLFADVMVGNTPPKNWFYLIAECDWNGSGSPDSTSNHRAYRRGDLKDIVHENKGK